MGRVQERPAPDGGRRGDDVQYMGDGTTRRFDATPDACGNYGALESVRTAQGRVATSFGMGVDVVRDFDGVRQVLAPSRLAEYAGTVPISCEGPESMSK